MIKPALIRLSFILVFLVIDICCSAQSFGFFGGANRNDFFDLQRDEGHLITNYQGDYGFSAGFSLSNVKIASLPFLFIIDIHNYKGTFYNSNGGLGGAYTTEATAHKTALGIEIIPIWVALGKSFEFGLGTDFSFLISHKTTGYQSFWGIGSPSTYINIENDSVNITNNFSFSICGMFQYCFPLTNSLSIAPRYRFLLGISNEFIETEVNIKSFQNFIEISIIKGI